MFDPGREEAVTAFAKYAGGSGWSNAPLWVVVRDKYTETLRLECIQPDRQTDRMHSLYDISASVTVQLKQEAQDVLTAMFTGPP